MLPCLNHWLKLSARGAKPIIVPATSKDCAQLSLWLKVSYKHAYAIGFASKGRFAYRNAQRPAQTDVLKGKTLAAGAC